MKNPKINFENAFEVSHKETSIKHHSGYVRIVKYLDNKKHSKPQMLGGLPTTKAKPHIGSAFVFMTFLEIFFAR